MSLVKIAGIQMACGPEKARNIDRLLTLMELAAEQEAGVVCFQELATTTWFPASAGDGAFALAEPIPGPTTETFQAAASRHGVVVVLPIFERADAGRYYNSAAVIDTDGQLLGVYRKMHVPLIPLWQEKYYFSPGDTGWPVFETSAGRLGIQVCWDNFFPEGSRILALKGAEILLAPTAAAFASQPRWRAAITANAISNGVFVFRVNRVGQEGRQKFYGKSFCVSPDGELINEPSSDHDGVVLAECDLSFIEQARRTWTFFRDRRPETYLELVGLEPRQKPSDEAAQEEPEELPLAAEEGLKGQT
jgi:N-carbamoylputrescine amidase